MNFRQNWYSPVVTVLLVLAVVGLGYLVIENRRLQDIIDDPQQYFSAIQSEMNLSAMPAIRGADVRGGLCDFDYGADEPATLMCRFSVRCHPCADNVEFWNEVAERYSGEGVRVVGICTGGPAEARAYVEEHAMAFPVLAVDDPYLIKAYGGNAVPQTLLVSPLGNVTDRWMGVLEAAQREAILASLAQDDQLTGSTPDEPEDIIP